MPTYEYSCNECGTYGSIHRTYKEDDGGMLCPKCGLNMARMYSAPGIILKGTGWGSKPGVRLVMTVLGSISMKYIGAVSLLL